MKLNKREKQAFEALRSVLDAIEQGEVIELDAADANAISSVFGIDLKAITKRKSEIAEFVRGKDDAYIAFNKPFAAWSQHNKVKSYGYFTFQIKTLADK